MANRVQIKWKDGINHYEILDFDSFYRLHQTSMFSAENLERMMDFHSSTTDGNYMYPFTSEDIKKTTIEEVKYEERRQDFVLSQIPWHRAKNRISLPFDKNKYYEGKITINTDFVQSNYIGVYMRILLCSTALCSHYDDKTYAVVINESRKEKSDNDNTLTLLLSLRAKNNGDVQLAEFEKTFKGIQIAEGSEGELEPHSTAMTNLLVFMKDKVKNSGYGDVTNKLSMSIENWIRNVKFTTKKEQEELTWEKK